LQFWRRRPLLPYEPRRPVPWGLGDVLLSVLIWALLPGAVFGLVRAAGIEVASPEAYEGGSVAPQQWFFAVASAVTLAAFFTSIAVVSLHSRASWRDFGFTLDLPTLRRDVWSGLGAFGLLAPVLYPLQYVLTLYFPKQHPIIEFMKQHPDGTLFALTFVSAVLVAPLFEEFLFRVLLQGWCEGVRRDMRIDALLVGRSAAGVDDSSREPAPPSRWSALLPIYFSSTLFSLAHYGHGAAPVSLLVLGIGLGILYQRTHRILPGMVVHFLLNLCSMTILFVEVFGRK
jgi:membrane protease YdiL (CAAX protease family)